MFILETVKVKVPVIFVQLTVNKTLSDQKIK